MSLKRQYIALLACIWVLSLSVASSSEAPLHVLEGNGLAVHYETSLRKAAEEVMEIYPSVEEELWSLFYWKPQPRPIILVTEGKEPFFGVDWGKTPIAAFAVPDRQLIVLDWGRVGRDPLRLHDVLKHEVCHIFLHQQIREALPRWLDEGVCQWASDGISELLADPRPSRLSDAASEGELTPLQQLDDAFPVVENDLILAYEESKSFVLYLVNRFGQSALLGLLKLAAEGYTIRDGLLRMTDETLDVLEKDWQASLKSEVSWLVKISQYLYEILFVVMAGLAVWGFLRQVLKKRAYQDDAPDDRSA